MLEHQALAEKIVYVQSLPLSSSDMWSTVYVAVAVKASSLQASASGLVTPALETHTAPPFVNPQKQGHELSRVRRFANIIDCKGSLLPAIKEHVRAPAD